MEIKTKKSDIIWNYLGAFLVISSQIIWLPFLLHYLSNELLGVWYIFVSIGGLVTLFDFGFSSQFSRGVSYAWSGVTELKKEGISLVRKESLPNINLIKSIIKACKMIYFFLASIATLIMCTGGSLYLYNIVPRSLHNEILLAWLVYIIAVFFNLYIGYYVAVLQGIGDIKKMNQAKVIARVVMLFGGIVALIMQWGLLGLAVSYLLSGFIQRILCKYFVSFQVLKNSNVEYENYVYKPFEIVKILWHNAWRDGLVTISQYITGQASVLLCGAFLTLSDTGIYSVSLQIINAIVQIARSMSSSYMPAVRSMFANNNLLSATTVISKSVVSYYIITLLSVVVFICLGIPIIQYIKPNFLIDGCVFVVLSIHLILIDRHRLSAAFISSLNELPYTSAFIVSSFLGIFFAWMMMSFFNLGIWGLILAPLTIQCLYNNWKWPLYLNKYLNTSEYTILNNGVVWIRLTFIKYIRR